MELITTGLGAGSYPEEKGMPGRMTEDDRRALLYPEHFQEFSDSREFHRSFEGETWESLSEGEQKTIIRNAMRIYSSARDCEGWKREYLKKNLREYAEFLRDEKGEREL